MFPSTHHFFELIRFDFIMDEDFKLYLMEVNLSPNITPSSTKYERNAVVREKMVYDVVNLIGAASYFDIMTRWVLCCLWECKLKSFLLNDNDYHL